MIFWVFYLAGNNNTIMGIADTNVADRHDHNTVIEGNTVMKSVGETQILFMIVIVLLALAMVVYAVKVAVDKCIGRVIRAVRREVVPAV